jgi:16S rRNA processing protein RimM
LNRAFLVNADGSQVRPVEVDSAWEHKGRVILKFRGIDDMSSAEELRGMELRIPLEDRPPAPEEEFYHSDLIGCEVVDQSGRSLGHVKGWREYGAAGLLEVKGEKEFLVPFAKAICLVIDVARKRIVVDLPEGLEDLEP